jgi:hypothetical protein
MVGMFASLCLASKKPSECEFFVPAQTDLAVKLLIDRVVPEKQTYYPQDPQNRYY